MCAAITTAPRPSAAPADQRPGGGISRRPAASRPPSESEGRRREVERPLEKLSQVAHEDDRGGLRQAGAVHGDGALLAVERRPAPGRELRRVRTVVGRDDEPRLHLLHELEALLVLRVHVTVEVVKLGQEHVDAPQRGELLGLQSLLADVAEVRDPEPPDLDQKQVVRAAGRVDLLTRPVRGGDADDGARAAWELDPTGDRVELRALEMPLERTADVVLVMVGGEEDVLGRSRSGEDVRVPDVDQDPLPRRTDDLSLRVASVTDQDLAAGQLPASVRCWRSRLAGHARCGDEQDDQQTRDIPKQGHVRSPRSSGDAAIPSGWVPEGLYCPSHRSPRRPSKNALAAWTQNGDSKLL